MALANYTDLKAAVSSWMARADLAGDAADFVTLGEAHLNREIDAVETDAILTGVVDNRALSISSLAVVAVLDLFLRDPDTSDELRLTPKTDGGFAYASQSSRPRYWAIDGDNIDFDAPLDQAYTFRLRYRQRFALSDSAPTNWLLTNHSDVYLSAVLIWGGVFIQDTNYAQTFSTILSQGIPAVKNIIAQKKRSQLTVDPALQRVGRGGTDFA